MTADNLTFLIKNIVGDSSLVGGTVSQRIGQVWNTGDIPFYAEKYKEITSRVVSSNAKHVASSASMSSCLSENNIWYLCFTINSNGIIENVKEIKAISERENMYPTTISIRDNFTDTLSYLNKYKQVINSLILLSQSIGSTIYAAYISPINQEDAHGRQISIVSLRELTQLETTQISSLLTSFRIHELVKQLTCESIKSAKAAIMSRNMSHNLGSHVMAYLKQHLGSVKDMLDKKVLYSLVPSILENKVDLKNIATTTEMPFLVGLGRFIGYLQERQDYIATVATDYIPYIAPVNLKDAMYDELNPDLRYARHNDTDDKNRPSNILLKYIAKSEGLSREEYNPNETNDHDIRIGFKGYKDGAPLKTTFGESRTVLRQINLGLPGGLIGRQAIFSIIENIIRNAAKHGVFDGQDKSLELIIDVIDGRDVQRSKHDVFKDRIFDEEIFNLLKDSTDIKNLQVITII